MVKNRKKTDEEKSYEGCYGKICKASEIVKFIERLTHDNFERCDKEQPRWTGNIWGHPGVGKTSLVKALKNKPVKFRSDEYKGYEIVDIPLAQIEEMGDILGVPEDFIEMKKGDITKLVLAKDSVLEDFKNDGWAFAHNGRVVTKTCPPEWVPTEEKPGIIIFDDGNRASIRIQKGLMQLVQDYKTIGWEIPAGWTILFTGNPDNQNYLVTTVDDAIITRQRHITMKPDAREWAVWAVSAGIDKRGINFILKYPEMMIGQRTNLRTLTEFFRCLERYKDIESHKDDVYTDGLAVLDQETLDSFLVFVTRDMKMIIEPEDILNGSQNIFKEIKSLMDGSEPRVDIIGVTCDRLFAHIVQNDYQMKKEHVQNFQKFVTFESIPEDMRHSLMRRIAEANTATDLKPFLLGNKEILKFVASSLRVMV